MRLINEGEQVEVGDIVAISAVDWGMYNEQHPRNEDFKIVEAMVYGEVIGFTKDERGLVIAPQVFQGGDIRCTLVIPFCTILKIWRLGNQRLFNSESTEA